MSLPGKEINRSFDAFGPVRIFDDGNKRYLGFGNSDEQSCWLKDQPFTPQHDYVRAMLLVLLFRTPKQAITLGLGAGTLNSCLHNHLPDLEQTVVELRPAVIEAAYKYFQLPREKRLNVYNDDAQEWLTTPIEKKADILFSDIYSADGLDEQQLSDSFLTKCVNRLQADGWLVLNCWQEHRDSDLISRLREHFCDIRSCTTQSGNWLILAGKQQDNQSTKQLKKNARELNPQLGFSLSNLLNRLQHHNR